MVACGAPARPSYSTGDPPRFGPGMNRFVGNLVDFVRDNTTAVAFAGLLVAYVVALGLGRLHDLARRRAASTTGPDADYREPDPPEQ